VFRKKFDCFQAFRRDLQCKKLIGRCVRRDKKRCVSLAASHIHVHPALMPHLKMIRSPDTVLRVAIHQIKQQRFFAIVTTINSRFTDAKPRSNPSIARCWSRSTEQNKLQQREFTCISNNDCGFGRSELCIHLFNTLQYGFA
jgi:hypothetical protein